MIRTNIRINIRIKNIRIFEYIRHTLVGVEEKSPVEVPTVLWNDPKDWFRADPSVQQMKQSIQPGFSSANHYVPETFLETTDLDGVNSECMVLNSSESSPEYSHITFVLCHSNVSAFTEAKGSNSRLILIQPLACSLAFKAIRGLPTRLPGPKDQAY